MNENGIDRVESFRINTTTTESPFDYQKNARLYIPNGMLFPDNEDERYIKALSENIVKLVKATCGHTVILFTSYSVLKTVYEIVKDSLNDFDLICMTRSNKGAIAEFKESENAVLFASGAMWEGVDCAGDCLSSIIIARLPYPLRSATMEQKKALCESTQEFVRKYAVPEMLIKLRQGVGRLIRTETDTGLVSILDSRAYEGANAKRIQYVLRKYTRIHNFDDIEKFFKEVKSTDYFGKEKG
jgi:ATP-dependent DNA helicase DinG